MASPYQNPAFLSIIAQATFGPYNVYIAGAGILVGGKKRGTIPDSKKYEGR
ncbi:hypothetical protein L21SP2_1637 [Salinispira pacifica]|uniref:Uncharacterized protein n=1 Tax=Salinispira pacifica TaxID=1307761 RepID=V5WGU1_9SPIO|nr:hypothetical protein L21SP2_1637 [Salinispira pacifica]